MELVGAEATVTIKRDVVVKERTPKTWRHPQIDTRIRRQRTKQEARILQRLSTTPILLNVEETVIHMKRIQGEQLSDTLTKKNMEKVGVATMTMHQENIYHGDLTTKNILITSKEAYLIDFGLGGMDARTEDKAVDLHILQTVIRSEKPRETQKLWESFLNTYNPKNKKEILSQLEEVNNRGRYK